MLKSREKEILNMLSENDVWKTYDELAKHFGITERSIRNDIKVIGIFLEENKLPQLKIDSKKGISYYSEYRKKVIEMLNLKENFYILNKDERLQAIAIFILANEKDLNIEKISDFFDISRSTVVSDIQCLKAEFNENGIELASNIKGYSLLAEERKIRSFFAKKLAVSLHEKTLHSEAHKIIENVNFDEINNFIRNIEDILLIEIETESYYKTLNLIFVSIIRFSKGFSINFPEENTRRLRETNEFKIIQANVEDLEKYFNIKFSINEIFYITILFLSANTNSLNEEFLESAEIHLISKTLILSVSDKMNYSFIQDLNLFKNIASHFRTALFRLKNNMESQNPFFENIKLNFGHIFPIIEESLEKIEQLSEIKFNEHEISYFVLHFASSMKYKDVTEKKNGILISDSANYLLKTSIETLFEINIISTLSVRKFNEIYSDFQNINYEIIITTKSLSTKFYRDLPVVNISQILAEKDIEILSKYLKYKSKSDVAPSQIVNLIKKNCVITDKDELILGLEEIFHDSEIKEMLESFSLTSMVNANLISLDKESESYEKSIKDGCLLLEKNKFVKPEYTLKVIQSFKKYSPYFLVKNNILISYTMDCSLVHKNGISFIRLKEPIDDKKNIFLKNVKFIITLCGKDPNYLLRLISELDKLSKDEKFLEIFTTTKNKTEIYDYLNK